jgi:hypothetical protein
MDARGDFSPYIMYVNDKKKSMQAYCHPVNDKGDNRGGL